MLIRGYLTNNPRIIFLVCYGNIKITRIIFQPFLSAGDPDRFTTSVKFKPFPNIFVIRLQIILSVIQSFIEIFVMIFVTNFDETIYIYKCNFIVLQEEIKK